MKIKKIKSDGAYIYPATIAAAVKDANFLNSSGNAMTQGEINQQVDIDLTDLKSKSTPTMWANILATKDTAVMVDGVKVEIPAYTNTVIKDFRTFAPYSGTSEKSNLSSIKKFDIGYNPTITSYATGTTFMFGVRDDTLNGMTNIKELNVSKLKTTSIYNFNFMFTLLRNVTELDVACFDTSRVMYMQHMFAYCYKLNNLDLSNWDVQKLRVLAYTFLHCDSLTSLDLSNWKTSNLRELTSAFQGCDSLESLKVNGEGWNTSKVASYTGVFAYCPKLSNLDLSNWDTTSATAITYMFLNCYSLTDITFGEGFGKAKASGLTLDLSTCGSNNSYVLTNNTYNSMLTMYDRATNGLPTMTIKFKAKHNLPDGFVAAMTARGYTITQA